MTKDEGQLIFKLNKPKALGLENFFISSSNKLAVNSINKWRLWTERKLILLGPTASGKSHLANFWASETCALKIDRGCILSDDIMEFTKHGALLIEDLDAFIDEEKQERIFIQEQLFHFFNALSQAKCYLLITGSTPVSNWGITIPDLFSRLSSYEKVNLMPPDDTLLTAVMVKQFEDKQIKASPEFISFVSKRLNRTFDCVRDFVDLIDELTLREKREVTIPVANMALDRLSSLEKKNKKYNE